MIFADWIKKTKIATITGLVSKYERQCCEQSLKFCSSYYTRRILPTIMSINIKNTLSGILAFHMKMSISKFKLEFSEKIPKKFAVLSQKNNWLQDRTINVLTNFHCYKYNIKPFYMGFVLEYGNLQLVFRQSLFDI